MLELAETHDFDVLLAIDTDTVVIGDVSRYGDPTAVAIKPENLDPVHRPRLWRRLYAELGIAEPSRSMVTTVDGRRSRTRTSTAAWSSCPATTASSLLDSWAKRVFDVLDIYERRPDIVPAPRAALDQPAVPGTGRRGRRHPGGSPLPVAANLSTTVRVHPLFAHEVTPPFVLHYHNEIDAARVRVPLEEPAASTR